MTNAERVEQIISKAIVERLRKKATEPHPNPTIDELEKMLNQDDPPRVDILPDGSLTVELPVYASDLAESITFALAEQAYRITDNDYEALYALADGLIRAWATELGVEPDPVLGNAIAQVKAEVKARLDTVRETARLEFEDEKLLMEREKHGDK